MMELSFVTEEYNDSDSCVSWYGIKFRACSELDVFLSQAVKSRLDDDEGTEGFKNCLRGLELTGMGQACLEEVLTADVQEVRDWAIGEALAETWLMEYHAVTFPWNMERDKRNPFASLPGADLIGFTKDKDEFRLVLGEVKTSTEKQSPPNVLYGRSGLIHQLDNLTDDFNIIRQLLIWLYHRTRNGYKQAYESSCTNYFNSKCKDIVLFGILIRDTSPNELDLSTRGKKLRAKLSNPTQYHLIALYLPWEIEQLSIHIRTGGDE